MVKGNFRKWTDNLKCRAHMLREMNDSKIFLSKMLLHYSVSNISDALNQLSVSKMYTRRLERSYYRHKRCFHFLSLTYSAATPVTPQFPLSVLIMIWSHCETCTAAIESITGVDHWLAGSRCQKQKAATLSLIQGNLSLNTHTPGHWN